MFRTSISLISLALCAPLKFPILCREPFYFGTKPESWPSVSTTLFFSHPQMKMSLARKIDQPFGSRQTCHWTFQRSALWFGTDWAITTSWKWDSPVINFKQLAFLEFVAGIFDIASSDASMHTAWYNMAFFQRPSISPRKSKAFLGMAKPKTPTLNSHGVNSEH